MDINFVEQILGFLNSEFGVVLVVLLVLLAVVSMIKKLIKTAILVIVIVSCAGVGLSQIQEAKDLYGFTITDNNLVVNVQDNTVLIPIHYLDGIVATATFLEDNDVHVSLDLKEQGLVEVVVPSWVYHAIVSPICTTTGAEINEYKPQED